MRYTEGHGPRSGRRRLPAASAVSHRAAALSALERGAGGEGRADAGPAPAPARRARARRRSWADHRRRRRLSHAAAPQRGGPRGPGGQGGVGRTPGGRRRPPDRPPSPDRSGGADAAAALGGPLRRDQAPGAAHAGPGAGAGDLTPIQPTMWIEAVSVPPKPLTSPALLSRLTPALPGRGGRLQKKKLAFAFSNPLSPGGRVCGGREGEGGVRGPTARTTLVSSIPAGSATSSPYNQPQN